ncbi:MAG: iron-sulfur cluster assembly accessory protein [Verrucomicrobiaceae bacterium]
MITVSDSAVKHLRELLQSKSAPVGTGLRLKVHRGGCAGMEYVMKLDAPGENDRIFEQDSVRVIVDPESLVFLDQSQIDYSDSLSDAGFKIHNPNAARSCGCGSSFEPLPG